VILIVVAGCGELQLDHTPINPPYNDTTTPPPPPTPHLRHAVVVLLQHRVPPDFRHPLRALPLPVLPVGAPYVLEALLPQLAEVGALEDVGAEGGLLGTEVGGRVLGAPLWRGGGWWWWGV